MIFRKELTIQNKTISPDSPSFIIAEAGVNHGGSMTVAKKLIDTAVDAGADAVKFQTFRPEHLILDSVEKAPYQKKTTDQAESQQDMLKKLEISHEQNEELKAYCRQKDIIFLTTPFDEQSIEELDNLDLPAFKIASTDTTNLPFLVQVAKRGKPIFLSTGMSYLSEIQMALESIYPYNREVILLQCTANYPIQDAEANLAVIETFKRHFDILIGYSDHSVGVGAGPFAVPMGAKVLEKHFTLDKEQDGPDHKASLSPKELDEFVQLVRKVDTYMGSPIKVPTLAETQTRQTLQKCIVAKQDIKAGEILSEKNMTAKRTGGKGISPIYYGRLVGSKAFRDYTQDQIIEEI